MVCVRLVIAKMVLRAKILQLIGMHRKSYKVLKINRRVNLWEFCSVRILCFLCDKLYVSLKVSGEACILSSGLTDSKAYLCPFYSILLPLFDTFDILLFKTPTFT